MRAIYAKGLCRSHYRAVRERGATARWVAANPGKARAKWHREKLRSYGLTIADYDALLAQQGGVCAICRQPETALDRSGTLRRLTVDHDHATSKVRGLLCTACNVSGFVDRGPAWLLTAVDYLAAPPARLVLSK